MRVACLDCETRFEIPDDLIDPSGQKVECCRCGLVFGVRSAAAPAEPLVLAAPRKTSLGAAFWALTVVFFILLGTYTLKPVSLYGQRASSYAAAGQLNGAYYTRPDGKTLFIVSGKVKNSSLSTMPCPKVSIKAFGGGVEAETFAFACSLPDRDALDGRMVADLVAELQKQGPQTLAAGEEKPFFALFPEPPKGLKEFEVEFSPR